LRDNAAASEDPVKTAEDPVNDDERVPVFGTWPRIYAAVVVNAIVIMALLALFSGWTF
jgi:hypothetical protein